MTSKIWLPEAEDFYGLLTQNPTMKADEIDYQIALIHVEYHRRKKMDGCHQCEQLFDLTVPITGRPHHNWTQRP